MEGLNAFDIDGLLTEDEANEFYASANGEQLQTPPDNQEEGGEEENPEESNIENADAGDDQQESVGKEINEEREGAQSDARKGASSPDVFYSSIARVAKKDGIFSNLDDEFIESIKGAEDFGEAMEKEMAARLDETQKRIYDFMNIGATQEEVRTIENTKKTLDYLKGLTAAEMEDESEQGEELRKTIIYNDFIARGFSQDRATRELKKSFSAGTDVDDAKEALESLTKHYEDNHNSIIAEQRKRHEAEVAQQKKAVEDFRKMVLDDEIVLGDQKLSKAQRQKIYDATQKPVYKDPDSGRLLTEIQRYQKEHPLEFLKQIGMWYVLTNGGKDVQGFTRDKVRSEKHKALRELESKIVAGDTDGSLSYMGSSNTDSDDILLSDDWKVGVAR